MNVEILHVSKNTFSRSGLLFIILNALRLDSIQQLPCEKLVLPSIYCTDCGCPFESMFWANIRNIYHSFSSENCHFLKL